MALSLQVKGSLGTHRLIGVEAFYLTSRYEQLQTKIPGPTPRYERQVWNLEYEYLSMDNNNHSAPGLHATHRNIYIADVAKSSGWDVGTGI